jgi:hypothetical protein
LIGEEHTWKFGLSVDNPIANANWVLKTHFWVMLSTIARYYSLLGFESNEVNGPEGRADNCLLKGSRKQELPGENIM